MKTTWSSRIIKLSSSARLLSASVTANQLAVSVRAGVIALKAVVGRFVTFLDFEEGFSIQDGKAATLGKGLKDSISALEALNQEFRKARQDGTQVSDSAFRLAIKSLSDASGVADDEYRAFGKVLNDAASFLDAYRIAYAKGVLDTAGVFDAQQLDITKAKTDSFAAADLASVGLGKTLADSFSALDSSTRLLNKGLFDNVSITDDVDGQASVLDDETMSFVKVMNQQSLVSDDFARVVAYARSYSDSFGVSDIPSVEAQKPFAESLTIADLFEHRFSKNPMDYAGLADVTLRDAAKAIHEPAFAADLFSFFMETARADTAVVSDAAFNSLDKPAQEALTVSDSFDRTAEFYRSPEDTAGISHAEHWDLSKTFYDTYVYGDYFSQDYVFPPEGMHVTDYFSPLFGKNPSENLALSDVYFKDGTKGIFETPTLSDRYASTLYRAFDDTMFVTDDVDGQASINDDQEVQFIKVRADQVAISDSIFYSTGFNRAYSDTAGALDAKAFGVGKASSDSFLASDIVVRAGGKARFDSAFLSDTSVRAGGKYISEQTSIADTGFLRSQGYSDFTYFAEDFVGASRTF